VVSDVTGQRTPSPSYDVGNAVGDGLGDALSLGLVVVGVADGVAVTGGVVVGVADGCSAGVHETTSSRARTARFIACDRTRAR
jgi:hypothetical protein